MPPTFWQKFACLPSFIEKCTQKGVVENVPKMHLLFSLNLLLFPEKVQKRLFQLDNVGSKLVKRQKVYVTTSWERVQKRDPHELFQVKFWVKERGTKQAVLGHEKFS